MIWEAYEAAERCRSARWARRENGDPLLTSLSFHPATRGSAVGQRPRGTAPGSGPDPGGPITLTDAPAHPRRGNRPPARWPAGRKGAAQAHVRGHHRGLCGPPRRGPGEASWPRSRQGGGAAQDARACARSATTSRARCRQGPAPATCWASSPASTAAGPRWRGTPGDQASDQEVTNSARQAGGALHLGRGELLLVPRPVQGAVPKLAGTPTATKPLAGMCDSARCPQATHHSCHRPVWAESGGASRSSSATIGRNQKTEKARLRPNWTATSEVAGRDRRRTPPRRRTDRGPNQRRDPRPQRGGHPGRDGPAPDRVTSRPAAAAT